MSFCVMVRFVAPFQSWRTTGRMSGEIKSNPAYTVPCYLTNGDPTKSGSIGSILQSMGASRDDDELLARFAEGMFGVRVDAPGRRVEDLQTTQLSGLNWQGEMEQAKSAKGGNMKHDLIGERQYLSSAHFLAALQLDDEELAFEANEALWFPARQPWLGSKNCLPCQPLGITKAPIEGTIEEALSLESVPLRATVQNPDGVLAVEPVECVLESRTYTGETYQDQPLTFRRDGQIRRRHVERFIRRIWINANTSTES